MRILAMSDTHLRHKACPFIPVPESDVLIHSGDACLEGTEREVREFADWFGGLKARHKVFVPGNHDWLFQKDPEMARRCLPAGVHCLIDEAVEIEGVRIYGSPWQPEFQDWAFNLPRGHRLREKWNRIPPGIDVLVTHGPPLRILDQNYHGEHCGCGDLYDVVVKRVKPKLHCFGHIHGCHGTARIGRTLFVNASVCDEAYRPNNDPIMAEIDAAGANPVDLPKVERPPAPGPLFRGGSPLW